MIPVIKTEPPDDEAPSIARHQIWSQQSPNTPIFPMPIKEEIPDEQVNDDISDNNLVFPPSQRPKITVSSYIHSWINKKILCFLQTSLRIGF